MEVCNGLDDDGDGEAGAESAADLQDGDGDGFSPCAGDCDDESPAHHPAAEEACDGEDRDCDGFAGEDEDTDGDGSPDCEDCGPDDPSMGPTVDELLGNGRDDDCDGWVDEGIDQPLLATPLVATVIDPIRIASAVALDDPCRTLVGWNGRVIEVNDCLGPTDPVPDLSAVIPVLEYPVEGVAPEDQKYIVLTEPATGEDGVQYVPIGASPGLAVGGAPTGPYHFGLTVAAFDGPGPPSVYPVYSSLKHRGLLSETEPGLLPLARLIPDREGDGYPDLVLVTSERLLRLAEPTAERMDLGVESIRWPEWVNYPTPYRTLDLLADCDLDGDGANDLLISSAPRDALLSVWLYWFPSAGGSFGEAKAWHWPGDWNVPVMGDGLLTSTPPWHVLHCQGPADVFSPSLDVPGDNLLLDGKWERETPPASAAVFQLGFEADGPWPSDMDTPDDFVLTQAPPMHRLPERVFSPEWSSRRINEVDGVCMPGDLNGDGIEETIAWSRIRAQVYVLDGAKFAGATELDETLVSLYQGPPDRRVYSVECPRRRRDSPGCRALVTLVETGGDGQELRCLF